MAIALGQLEEEYKIGKDSKRRSMTGKLVSTGVADNGLAIVGFIGDGTQCFDVISLHSDR